jgi:hypothetical protein
VAEAARVAARAVALEEGAEAQVAALALVVRVAEEGAQVVRAALPEAALPEPAEAKAGHPGEGLAEEPAAREAREELGELAARAGEERAGLAEEATTTTRTRMR